MSIAQLEKQLQDYIDDIPLKEHLSIEMIEDNCVPIIKIGDWQSSDFNFLMSTGVRGLDKVHKSIESDLDAIYSIIHSIEYSKEITKLGLEKKYENKVFHRYFGSSKYFIKALKAKTLEHFIYRLDEKTIVQNCFVYKYKGYRTAINYRLNNYYRNISLVEQAKKDGLQHLIPFVIAFEKSPKQLKKQFGKGIWKRLCMNSKTRNLLLLQCAEERAIKVIDEIYAFVGKRFSVAEIINKLDGYNEFIDAIVDSIAKLIGIKSALLSNNYAVSYRLHSLSAINWVNHNAKVSDKIMVNGYMMLAQDTSAYTEINPKWSVKRLQLEHDKGVKRANEQYLKDLAEKYQDPQYHQPLFWSEIPSEINGVKIKLLNCEFDYLTESIEQDHCIYDGYWKYAKDKLIVTFSLQSENQRTTAAYNFNRSKQSISIAPFQHLGYQNDTVHCSQIKHTIRSKSFRELLGRIEDERYGRVSDISSSDFTTIRLFSGEVKQSA